jgi:hypothetical protein
VRSRERLPRRQTKVTERKPDDIRQEDSVGDRIRRRPGSSATHPGRQPLEEHAGGSESLLDRGRDAWKLLDRESQGVEQRGCG